VVFTWRVTSIRDDGSDFSLLQKTRPEPPAVIRPYLWTAEQSLWAALSVIFLIGTIIWYVVSQP
jgi:hypothetical protein